MKKSGVIFTAKKSNLRRFLFIAFLTTLSLSFFTFQKFNTPSSNKAIASAGQNVVTIQNTQFTPGQMTIPVGTTVVWMNQESNIPHTVTSDAGLWDSGTLQPGQSFSHTFTTPGTFTYHCNIHPFMHGSIVVTGTGTNPQTTPPPSTYIPEVPPPPPTQPYAIPPYYPPVARPVPGQPYAAPPPPPSFIPGQNPSAVAAEQSQSQSQSMHVLTVSPTNISSQQSQTQSQAIITSSP